jgi:hypothetical protein
MGPLSHKWRSSRKGFSAAVYALVRLVRGLARQMAPIFKAQGIHQEALAALRLFCKAAEQEAATVEMVRRVVEYLYRARHNPELRLETAE